MDLTGSGGPKWKKLLHSTRKYQVVSSIQRARLPRTSVPTFARAEQSRPAQGISCSKRMRHAISRPWASSPNFLFRSYSSTHQGRENSRGCRCLVERVSKKEKDRRWHTHEERSFLLTRARCMRVLVHARTHSRTHARTHALTHARFVTHSLTQSQETKKGEKGANRGWRAGCVVVLVGLFFGARDLIDDRYVSEAWIAVGERGWDQGVRERKVVLVSRYIDSQKVLSLPHLTAFLPLIAICAPASKHEQQRRLRRQPSSPPASDARQLWQRRRPSGLPVRAHQSQVAQGVQDPRSQGEEGQLPDHLFSSHA